MRGDDPREPFLPAVVRERLMALNPGLVTDENITDVLHRLRRVRADQRGNEAFLNALRGRWTIYDAAAQRERDLTLIAYDDLDAIAREAQAIIAQFPGWLYDAKRERPMRLKLYKLLSPHIQADDKTGALKATVDALLRMSDTVTK